MKLVADANVLFSLVRETSVTRQLVDQFAIELVSPVYVLDELKNHKTELLKKSGQKKFEAVLEILNRYVQFIELDYFKKQISSVKEIISDPSDIVYLALAKELDLVIWSNDTHFKEQSIIHVVNTAELIDLLD